MVVALMAVAVEDTEAVVVVDGEDEEVEASG